MRLIASIVLLATSSILQAAEPARYMISCLGKVQSEQSGQ